MDHYRETIKEHMKKKRSNDRTCETSNTTEKTANIDRMEFIRTNMLLFFLYVPHQPHHYVGYCLIYLPLDLTQNFVILSFAWVRKTSWPSLTKPWILSNMHDCKNFHNSCRRNQQGETYYLKRRRELFQFIKEESFKSL